MGLAAGLLSALGLLAGCVEPPPPGASYAYGRSPAMLEPSGAGGRKIAALLPLSGPNAEVAQSMRRAAQLALEAQGTPELEVRDTRGTPDGAAAAAREALAAGAGILIGPLTAGETDAVTPVAQGAGVPVLAFTSDASKARPGVWTLGIAPQQQVRRLVLAVQQEGKSRLSAVVPDNPFGNALADGLNAAASQAGLPPPRIVRFAGGRGRLDAAMKEAADYAARRGAVEAQGRGARSPAETGEQPQPTPPEPTAPTQPPPYDTLLLGTVGDQASQAAPLLAAYEMRGPGIRLLGPALWARDGTRLPGLAGAWYAAPDPGPRGAFERRYAAKYGSPPRDLASLAYDAAAIARAAATPAGFDPNALMRPDGYTGADGVLVLLPDGQVRRGLAIFEVDRGGSRVVQPSPSSLAVPGT